MYLQSLIFCFLAFEIILQSGGESVSEKNRKMSKSFQEPQRTEDYSKRLLKKEGIPKRNGVDRWKYQKVIFGGSLKTGKQIPGRFKKRLYFLNKKIKRDLDRSEEILANPGAEIFEKPNDYSNLVDLDYPRSIELRIENADLEGNLGDVETEEYISHSDKGHDELLYDFLEDESDKKSFEVKSHLFSPTSEETIDYSISGPLSTYRIKNRHQSNRWKNPRRRKQEQEERQTLEILTFVAKVLTQTIRSIGNETSSKNQDHRESTPRYPNLHANLRNRIEKRVTIKNVPPVGNGNNSWAKFSIDLNIESMDRNPGKRITEKRDIETSSKNRDHHLKSTSGYPNLHANLRNKVEKRITIKNVPPVGNGNNSLAKFLIDLNIESMDRNPGKRITEKRDIDDVFQNPMLDDITEKPTTTTSSSRMKSADEAELQVARSDESPLGNDSFKIERHDDLGYSGKIGVDGIGHDERSDLMGREVDPIRPVRTKMGINRTSNDEAMMIDVDEHVSMGPSQSLTEEYQEKWHIELPPWPFLPGPITCDDGAVKSVKSSFYAEPKEFRHVVSVQYQFSPERPPEHICAGVIYGPKHVLVAAHCIHNLCDDYGLMVTQTNNLCEKNGFVNVKEVIENEFYDEEFRSNDIAILKLENEVTPTAKLPDLSSEGNQGYFFSIGWRELLWNRFKRNATMLLQKFPMVRHPRKTKEKPGTLHIAPGKLDLTGTSRGNDGGILINLKGQLVGLQSSVITKSEGYEVYTRIRSYLNWINVAIRNGNHNSS
ncbi:uncharacterized protein LOC105704385 [Orussus abietinus]|uniref:uncharacterized protein LOC105704385 n=1 Tax=Orussus abietinus TaxID=222816 RepID=UPI0006257F08|nr:uncharacterized protein LOC105704385 [Orussus abietinus]